MHHVLLHKLSQMIGPRTIWIQLETMPNQWESQAIGIQTTCLRSWLYLVCSQWAPCKMNGWNLTTVKARILDRLPPHHPSLVQSQHYAAVPQHQSHQWRWCKGRSLGPSATRNLRKKSGKRYMFSFQKISRSTSILEKSTPLGPIGSWINSSTLETQPWKRWTSKALLCLFKEITDATGTDAREDLHEFGGRDAEEGHARLPGSNHWATHRWVGKGHLELEKKTAFWWRKLIFFVYAYVFTIHESVLPYWWS